MTSNQMWLQNKDELQHITYHNHKSLNFRTMENKGKKG